MEWLLGVGLVGLWLFISLIMLISLADLAHELNRPWGWRVWVILGSLLWPIPLVLLLAITIVGFMLEVSFYLSQSLSGVFRQFVSRNSKES